MSFASFRVSAMLSIFRCVCTLTAASGLLGRDRMAQNCLLRACPLTPFPTPHTAVMGCGIVKAAMVPIPRLGGLYETSRFHQSCWWRSSLAARGACAAGGQAADHRVPRRWLADRPARMGRGICAPPERTRLDRGPPSRSSTNGGRDAPSAMPRSRPSSSGSRSMSFWLVEPKQRSRQSRRHRSSRSSSRRRETRSAAAWSLHWRDRAATSPACQTWEVISLPNASNFCASFSRICVG
jgi:hypothetical protein